MHLKLLLIHESWGEAGSANYGKPWKRRAVLTAPPSESQRKSFTCLIWEPGQGKSKFCKGAGRDWQGPSTGSAHTSLAPMCGPTWDIRWDWQCHLCVPPSLKCSVLYKGFGNYIPHLETNQFKIHDWWERSNFPFFRVCVYIWGRGIRRRGESIQTWLWGDCWVAGVHMLVVQPPFTLTTNLADSLFLRVELDLFYLLFFHTALVQCFCGNYANYMSHHRIFSTSFDLTFKTNKRIIIFMGNLCFMVWDSRTGTDGKNTRTQESCCRIVLEGHK